MKWLFVCMIVIMPVACTRAQKKQPNSKRATTVDSINTPPRMDGNTGVYDTVKNPKRKSPQPDGGKGAEYNYRIGTDTIGINKKPSRKP